MALFGLTKQQEASVVQDYHNQEQQSFQPVYQQLANEELGKMMLDSTDLVQRIRLQLLGYIETSPGEFKQIGEKFMNDKGAAAVVSILDGSVGKEIYLSKISDEDKVRITRMVWVSLIEAFIKNYEEWGMSSNTSKWNIIMSIVVNQVYVALCRAVDGTEKGFFADTHSSQGRTVISQTAGQQQPKTFW